MEHISRKSVRLKYYDYSQNGYYYVTICTHNRQNIFGTTVGGGVLDAPGIIYSQFGKIVESQIEEINKIYIDVTIDKYVIMPNHIHMIIKLEDGSSRTPTPTPANARLPALISTFKRFTNKKAGSKLWQRSYYEHVIRSESAYLGVWEYIDTNLAQWDDDEYNTETTL